MRVLMYGWEFPPIQSGGLGVACQGIVEGLLGHQHEVFLVLPKTAAGMPAAEGLIIMAAEGTETPSLISTSLYSPYASTEAAFRKHLGGTSPEIQTLYGRNLLEAVHQYATNAATYAKKFTHDVIHSHDWLTAEAGVQAKKISEKPLVLHMHATELDRSGDQPNQAVFDLERRGMEQADRVIAVSEYTKQMLIQHYGISEWKIEVVHNAVNSQYHSLHHLKTKDKIVLFLGRMTMQKGPDYFLKMAKRVLEHMKHVKFVMAGDGDMMHQIIEMAITLGIERHVLFSGFLTGDEVARAYNEADLYVMPSVSEPFGIAPLEAIKQGTPVLISKQSGVSEVIKNALRADFWDVDEMANQVIAALQYPALHQTLREHSGQELKKSSWLKQAGKISEIYRKLLPEKK